MSESSGESINPGQGRKTVQRLIDSGRLQMVTSSRTHAERLLKQSHNHLTSAAKTAEEDPEGAYSALYDAARKALVAVLEVQGLRPTSKGGHIVICEALQAQIDPPIGNVVPVFNRMRRSRNGQEYPELGEPELTTRDVLEDLEKSKTIVEVAQKLLGQFPVFESP